MAIKTLLYDSQFIKYTQPLLKFNKKGYYIMKNLTLKNTKIATLFAASAAVISMSSAHAMSSDAASNETADNKYYVTEARELVKEFGGQLKPALKAAMKSGGPTAAVEVCHTKAPQIAADLAAKSGWEITRVSLKPRGENATADSWEKAVLERFEKQKSMGMKPSEIEFAETVAADGKTDFRYMKAVGTGDVCLNCHGTNIAAPVKEALAKYYPKDTATGYAKGDIRGAFSFSKEVK